MYISNVLKKYFGLYILLFACSVQLKAQDSTALRGHINMLCSKSFAGRGYVGKGMQKAARYIEQQFKEGGLLAFPKGYLQPFSYAVNTFPGSMNVRIDGRPLEAGKDYLVYPASSGAQAEQLKLRIIDGQELVNKVHKKSTDPSREWEKLRKKMGGKKYAYYLKDVDSLKALMQWKSNKDLLAELPRGVYLVARKNKPIWPVSQQAYPATLLELYDTTLELRRQRVDVAIANRLVQKFDAENVVGYVPGSQYPDSFIVVTAHYDHLGKMGSSTLFPGASDNASGTAMMMELAKYYAAHPGKYTMVFIAFSGEEAGLLGSAYFVENSPFPLQNIRFLLNIDIFGDATNGLAVVNGEARRDEFQVFAALNQSGGENGFVFPEIRRGGPASNSDHYHFVEKGVPAFFIFSMGGKGYYHDIWDKTENVTLKNIPEAGELIKRFIASF